MNKAEKAAEPSMDEILASIRKIIAEEPPANGVGQPAVTAGQPSFTAPAAKKPDPAPLPTLDDLDDLVDSNPAAQTSKYVPPAAAPRQGGRTSLLDELTSLRRPGPGEAAVRPEPIAPIPTLGSALARSEPRPLPVTSKPEITPPAPAPRAADPVPAAPVIKPVAPAPAAKTAPPKVDPPAPAPALPIAAAIAAAANPPIAAPPPAAPSPAAVLPASVRTLEDSVAELLRPMLRQWLDANMPRIVERALQVELAEGVKPTAPKQGG